jgi:predicted nuclease of predicted toxin-antitoxin system
MPKDIMRIKLDENLPTDLSALLESFGHEVDTVPQEGLTSSPDEEVWRAANRENRFFITQDLDFSDIRKYVPGTHPGLLLLRLESPSRKAIIERIQSILQAIPIDRWSRCLVVASDHKIRIRQP